MRNVFFRKEGFLPGKASLLSRTQSRREEKAISHPMLSSRRGIAARIGRGGGDTGRRLHRGGKAALS